MSRKVLPGIPSRSLRRCYSYTPNRAPCHSVRTAPPHFDISHFRNQAFTPESPLVLPINSALTGGLPAIPRWFIRASGETSANNDNADHAAAAYAPSTLSSYLEDYLDWLFPFELVVSRETSPGSTAGLAAFHNWLLQSKDFQDEILAGIIQSATEESCGREFFQLEAPLRLLQKALRFNEERRLRQHDQAEHKSFVQLYIAQSSLADLPPALQADLPTPDPVRHAGQGDVYGSSIWLGTEPTYTPLHRDPNPNLFYQLCSRKTVRLLPPAVGDRVFFEVQVQIRRQGGNSRIRGTEMMEGREREALHNAVWDVGDLAEHMQEAELGPGEALFIPKGWWHSVKSSYSRGYLNSSVNWWFR